MKSSPHRRFERRDREISSPTIPSTSLVVTTNCAEEPAPANGRAFPRRTWRPARSCRARSGSCRAGDRLPELHDGIGLPERHLEACATANSMPSIARACDRSQNQTPPGYSTRRVQAKRVTRRVLPTPPMPSTETSLRRRRSWRRGLDSCCRPTKVSRSAGKPWRSCASARDLALPDDAVRLGAVLRSAKADVAAADLEQLDRLLDPVKLPMSVRMQPQRRRPQRAPGVFAQQRRRPQGDRHDACDPSGSTSAPRRRCGRRTTGRARSDPCVARSRDRQDRRHAPAVRLRWPTPSAMRSPTTRRSREPSRGSRRVRASMSGRSACAQSCEPMSRAAPSRSKSTASRPADGRPHHVDCPGGQTLLSEAREARAGGWRLRIHSHGHWQLHGIEEPIELFESATATRCVPPLPQTAPRLTASSGKATSGSRCASFATACRRNATLRRPPDLHRLAASSRRREARVGARHGRRRQDPPRHALRLDAAGRIPGRCLVLRPVAGARCDGILFAVAQGLEVPLGQADPVVQLGRRSPAAASACRSRQLRAGGQVRRRDAGPLARAGSPCAVRRHDQGSARHRRRGNSRCSAAGPRRCCAAFLEASRTRPASASPGPDDVIAIGQLVKVLDCLPLAIELAAARVRVLGTASAARAHEGALRRRSSRTPGRNDRQATLRAAFDWSWDLLSEAEKGTLARLSVFEGGFTLESASAVVDLNAAPASVQVIDLVRVAGRQALRAAGARRAVRPARKRARVRRPALAHLREAFSKRPALRSGDAHAALALLRERRRGAPPSPIDAPISATSSLPVGARCRGRRRPVCRRLPRPGVRRRCA